MSNLKLYQTIENNIKIVYFEYHGNNSIVRESLKIPYSATDLIVLLRTLADRIKREINHDYA